jgi:hypothetical protein
VWNVTRPIPLIGPSFTPPFPRSFILPGNGNYRYYLNAGIIAMTMDGFVKRGGVGLDADRHARGNQR